MLCVSLWGGGWRGWSRAEGVEVREGRMTLRLGTEKTFPPTVRFDYLRLGWDAGQLFGTFHCVCALWLHPFGQLSKLPQENEGVGSLVDTLSPSPPWCALADLSPLLSCSGHRGFEHRHSHRKACFGSCQSRGGPGGWLCGRCV